jgi:PAS domain S-box-containing protein
MALLRSIKRQLVALVVLSFVALVLIGGGTAWSIYVQRLEAERRANLEVAHGVASAFQAYVEGTREQVAAIGQALALTERPAAATAILDEAAARRPSLRSIAWASPDGRVLQSSDLTDVGSSVADHGWFSALSGGAEWAVGILVRATTDGAPTFAIAEGVRNGDGRLRGVVFALVDADRLDERELRLQRPGDAAVGLVDSTGRLVTRTPRVELSWEARVDGDVDLVRRALAGEDATGDTESVANGEPFIGAAVPVRPFGWVARAGRSRAEVLAPIRRDITRAVGFGLLAAVAALGATALAGQRIAAGLRRLERHAEQLGRGERPQRGVEGAKELENLGRAFDDMAARLLAAGAAQELLTSDVELERRRLELMFRTAPAGLVVLDGTTLQVRWANAAYLAYLDEPYRSRGIEGLRVEEFLPRARENGLLDIFERVAREGAPYEDPELRFEGFARGVTYYRWSLRPFPAAEGHGTDLLLLVAEVTDLVQARLAIEAERLRLETVLETLPVGVFIADHSGRLVRTNAAARAIPGAEALLTAAEAEVVARWSDSGAKVEPEETGIARALRGADTLAGQIVDLVATDGTITTVVNRAAPIRDAAGRITGAVAAMQDVTTDRRTQRIREVLLEAGAAVAQSLQPDEVAERIARLAVPRLADWCTIDRVEPDGSVTLLALAHPDAAKEARAREERRGNPPQGSHSLVGRVTQTRRPVLVSHITRADLEALARDPEHVAALERAGHHSLVAVPLLVRGEPLGALTLASAESRRCFGEEDVRVAEELAHVAAQAIDSARLFEETQQAVRHRDEVLAVVSHDLRTPLATVVMGAAALAASAERADTPSDRVGAIAARIRLAGERMARMVSDLLDLASLEQGRLGLHAATVAAAELVHEAADEARPLAEAKGLEFGWSAPADLPPVRCDGGRVLQVLGNLLSNAIKAAESGFVLLRVAAAGAEVRFEVADSGPGIPESDLPHIFDRFRRGRTAAYRGTGLGLAIARGIVEAHGGRIWAESRLGAGTRVFFTLPVADAAPAQAKIPGASA